MKKCIFAIILVLLLCVFTRVEVRAAVFVEELLEEYDFDDIDDMVDGIDFKGMVMTAVGGGDFLDGEGLAKNVARIVQVELKNRASELVKIITIGVMSALFANLSASLKGGQVQIMGRLVGNALLVTSLASTYVAVRQLAVELLGTIQSFLKILMPTYVSCMALSGGALSAVAFGEGMMLLAWALASVFSGVVVGGCNAYVVLASCDSFMGGGILQKLCGLLMKWLKILLKMSMVLVAGLNFVKGMIAPVADKVQTSALIKAVSLIPGIGDAAGSVTGTVVGAGVLIRNGIGVASLGVMVVICFFPVLSLSVYVGVYQLVEVVLSAIAGRETACTVGAFAEAMKLMLMTVLYGSVLVFVVVAIMCMTTDAVY